MSLKHILFSLGLLVFTSAAQPSLAQESLGLDSLCVRGTRFVPRERVLLEFGLTAGERSDGQDLADGIRRLHRSHRFESIEARLEILPDGKRLLVLHVSEYPRISRIRWEGLNKIKRDEVEKNIRVTTGSYARPLLLLMDREAILDYCRDEGYHAATVVYELDVDERGRGELVFRIDEGKKSKIQHMRFEGNEKLSSSLLTKTVGSKPKRWYKLRTWFNANAYQPDSVDTDVGRLIRAYNQEGMLDARVLETRKEFNEARDRVTLTYVMDEGPQYYFGNIEWQGNETLPDSMIENLLYFESGEEYSGYRLDYALASLSNWLYDQGHLYNQVNPERQIDGTTVNLQVRIREGVVARVRDIVIEGNAKSSDKVIRREVKIFPGELFNRGKLMRSQRDIFMLRFYDDVQLDPRPDPATGDVDLIFRVRERNLGKVGAGITYSETTSITGFIQLGAQNFRGLGETVDFQWEFGERVHLFNIGFTKPWFRDRPMTLNFNIYRSQSNLYREYYKDEKRGFAFGLGRAFPWLEYSRISANYRAESVKLYDFSEAYVEGGGGLVSRDWPEIESSIQFSFWRNSTDSPFLPSRGTRFRTTAKFAGGILGGKLKYQKYMSYYTWYQKLLGPIVLRYHQAIGLVDGLDNPDQVPDRERFRLGGNRVTPLRGYADYSVVPEGNSPYLGGRSMGIGTVECIYGVNNSIQIIIPFFDFGGTWNSLSESDFTTLRRSVGFGARIEVPMMGVMGFDWGYPLDSTGTEEGRFHFKMGTDF